MSTTSKTLAELELDAGLVRILARLDENKLPATQAGRDQWARYIRQALVVTRKMAEKSRTRGPLPSPSTKRRRLLQLDESVAPADAQPVEVDWVVDMQEELAREAESNDDGSGRGWCVGDRVQSANSNGWIYGIAANGLVDVLHGDRTTRTLWHINNLHALHDGQPPPWTVGLTRWPAPDQREPFLDAHDRDCSCARCTGNRQLAIQIEQMTESMMLERARRRIMLEHARRRI